MHQISEEFFRHFRDYGFECHERTGIVSDNPTLLFNISGGVIYEEVIAGESAPKVPRIASVQSCLRTDSWKKIGISGRHHIAFEMLGHFSLYELAEADAKNLMIESAFNFLTGSAGLDFGRLAVTIHPGDRAASTAWRKAGVGIIFEDEKNTDINPGRTKSGLRTEILWRRQAAADVRDRSAYVELWNLVFAQFNGPEIFCQPLEKVAADSGVSLDRVLTAMEDREIDYLNSRWRGPVETISCRCEGAEIQLVRRLADMVGAMIKLFGEGLIPGNKEAPYVLRKIVREACILAERLNVSLPEICRDSYRFWVDSAVSFEAIAEAIALEAAKFEKCLRSGRQACQKLLKQKNGELDGPDLDFLHDTHGFPRELALREKTEWEKKR